jgi:hypothetical protein
MSEEEDFELQALQRQLDDAFQSTRPRPAFEDELWLRMQSRRPIWSRIRDGVIGLVAGLREAPAVPAAAVAIALIVVIGAGITLSGLHPGGAGTSATTGKTQDGAGNFGGTTAGPAAPVQFSGPLPAPGLSQPAASPIPPTYTIDGQSYQASYSVYFGAATLTWAGKLDVTATTLPVYRFQEPTRADAQRFAASVGAVPAPQAAQEGLGTFAGSNFVVVVTGSTVFPSHEPTFRLSDSVLINATDPMGVASAYLSRHGLLPTWPYQLDGRQSIDSKSMRVTFLRSFDLGAQGVAPLVDNAGSRYGTEVDLGPGKTPAVALGPLPLPMVSSTFPIVTADQAIRAALALSAPAGKSIPAVRLTGAELVYVLVPAGDHSFYEPAFLFSGLFTDQGVTYVKRVLVPAVDPAFIIH